MLLPWHHRYGWCGRASESVLGLGGGGRANVYGICELSDFGLNKHQLGLAQVLALEQYLQVQERLQFCLNSSIMRVLRKLSPCHPDQLLDILLNLIYAYSGRGAKGILGRGLLLVRCGNWRSGLGCRSAGVCVGSLGGWLAGCKTDARSRSGAGNSHYYYAWGKIAARRRGQPAACHWVLVLPLGGRTVLVSHSAE